MKNVKKKLMLGFLVFLVNFSLINSMIYMSGRFPLITPVTGYVREQGTNELMTSATVKLWVISTEIDTF